MAVKLLSWRHRKALALLCLVVGATSLLACGSSSNTSDGGTARIFACGDASCSSASQACRHTVGGAPPGVDLESCEALSAGQADCAKTPGNGCACEEDAGALYVQCDVP